MTERNMGEEKFGSEMHFAPDDPPKGGVDSGQTGNPEEENSLENQLDIIEDNGKVRLAKFPDSRAIFECSSLAFSHHPHGLEQPVVAYRPVNEKDRPNWPLLRSEPSINGCIDLCLQSFERRLADFNKWRKEMREKDIESFNYIEGIRHFGIMGTDRHIDPRLVRIFRNELVPGEDYNSTNTAIFGLPDELTSLMHKKFTIVADLSVVRGDVAIDEDLEDDQAFNLFLDGVRGMTQKDFKFTVDENPELQEVDEFSKFKEQLIGDLENYMPFLERAYNDVEKFIQGIRGFKTIETTKDVSIE